jgi:hypothetical protein
MNDPLGILGFYFTLIGFLTGIFFTRLDSWYNDVRAKEALVDQRTTTSRLQDLKEDLIGLKNSAPLVSFIAIGIFLTVLGLLSLYIPLTNSPVNPTIFLYTPLWVTVATYWIGGIALLVRAAQLIKTAIGTINSKI